MIKIFRLVASHLIAVALLATSIQTEAKEKIEEISSDEGYFLVAYSGNVPPYYLSIVNLGFVKISQDLGDFSEKSDYRLIPISEGKYKYSRLKTNKKAGYYFLRNREFNFEIEAGKINYAGDLEFELVNKDRLIHGITNRITKAYQWMSKNHPELLAKYPLVYNGIGEDNFISFYTQLKEQNQ